MKVTVGLDLSINSTGVVINSKKGAKYYIITPSLTKKQQQCDYIQYRVYEKGAVNDEKLYMKKEQVKTNNIYNITKMIEKILFEENKIKKGTPVMIEGVAFCASGDVVGLAGLNYQVRYMLINHGITPTIVSPTENKKQAVGIGGAEKDIIIDAFQRCTNFQNPLNVKIDDIADAYFLSTFETEIN